jgi:hypothetical protein
VSDRRKKEEGRRKKEEGRRKKEEGRRKKERKNLEFSFFFLNPIFFLFLESKIILKETICVYPCLSA